MSQSWPSSLACSLPFCSLPLSVCLSSICRNNPKRSRRFLHRCIFAPSRQNIHTICTYSQPPSFPCMNPPSSIILSLSLVATTTEPPLSCTRPHQRNWVVRDPGRDTHAQSHHRSRRDAFGRQQAPVVGEEQQVRVTVSYVYTTYAMGKKIDA